MAEGWRMGIWVPAKRGLYDGDPEADKLARFDDEDAERKSIKRAMTPGRSASCAQARAGWAMPSEPSWAVG